jgi:hypothetical protein
MRSRVGTLLAAVAVAVAAVVPAGCGSSSSSSTGAGGSLAVSPANPHPSSNVTFSFQAPLRSGRDGKVINSYSLSVTGPAGANCKGSQEAAGPTVDKGATARITVGPAQLKTQWCVGPYTARVFEIQRPYCKPGAMCPQYVHVAGIVARTSFDISK